MYYYSYIYNTQKPCVFKKKKNCTWIKILKFWFLKCPSVYVIHEQINNNIFTTDVYFLLQKIFLASYKKMLTIISKKKMKTIIYIHILNLGH